MAWEGARGEGDEDHVQAVDREGEVGDELGACDQGDDGDGPGYVSAMFLGGTDARWSQGRGVRMYMKNPPSSNQTSANSQPCVLSPRM